MFIAIMRWIVRVSIILILILNGVSVYFGIKLFNQREELKGRTQKLESTIKQVAATIETDNPDVKVNIPDDQLKTFKSVPGGPPNMDVVLGQLVTAAQNQLIRLNSTRSELSETKTTLAKTQDELKRTQNELQIAQNTIADQKVEIEKVKNTLSEKEVEIANLIREKSDLTAKVKDLQSSLENLEAEKRNLQDELAKTTNERDYWKKIAKPIVDRRELAKKKTGDVRFVNKDWNFVVIKLTEEIKDILPSESELLIHRYDKLVGKVKVLSLLEDYAIAEILTDWEQMPIETGDYVAYPLSPEEQAALAKLTSTKTTQEPTIETSSTTTQQTKTTSLQTKGTDQKKKESSESALDILSSVSTSSSQEPNETTQTSQKNTVSITETLTINQ